ncbi:hypothetical protein BJ741DRAFT_660881 [Chytriomyces cf. hyalinus JEL632]|nr:hypothetical protein BJ741DRAFT_660881 [Chytriomyces cf. hyalinus JEL632]
MQFISYQTIVVELDDLFCQRLQRKHTSNRAFLVISATTVVRKCSSPQCKDLPESSVKTAIGVFPSDFKDVVKQLLHNQQQQEQVKPQEDAQIDLPVTHTVAKQRFEHHNGIFPGTAVLECVRRDNKLVSRVIKDTLGPKISSLQGIIKAIHDPFCTGTQHAHTSNNGLEILCDGCSFRFPETEPDFLAIPAENRFSALNTFLVQVNNNTTNITVNNYNGENVQLDVQFNEIAPIFPDEELNLVMFRSFNGHAGDIAYVVYHLGKELFGVVSKKDATEWWAWDSRVGRWNTGKHYLEFFCMRTMVGYYEGAQQYFRLHTPDPTLAKNREIRFEQIRKRLNDRELVHIFNSAAVHFKTHSPNFGDKLDSNPALIGFTNGVFDLDVREFRDANPADYMSMSCGYAFEQKVDPVIRAEIDKFFEDIQPGRDERRYLQKFLGSCIRGGAKTDELFHIFTGKTRNGKSVLADVMKYSLGDYYTTIKATMLTGQQGASSEASPDMMDLRNRRLAMDWQFCRICS